ncbi:MAG: hypothetical protein ACP5VN_03750 [Acidobacteriota bacterium]
MLFEGDSKDLSPELFERLKERAREVSRVLRETREANRRLEEENRALRAEAEKLQEKVRFYEKERQELSGLVEEILKEFEAE